MTLEERAWLLISRSVSGEISAEELEELESIFLAEPGLRADYQLVVKLKTITPGASSIEERRAMERGLDKFDQSMINENGFAEKVIFNYSRLDPLQRGHRKKWMLAASAVIMLMAGLWAKYYLKQFNKVVEQQVVVTPNGKRVHTILPDGSSVWLNAASSIKFADNLNESSKRDIFLSGEAYFDVKHDAKHPFIVHAGKLSVVVLGTAFNVRAYKSDNFIETTLIRGKVEVMNESKPGANIVLYPNEKITISTRKDLVKKADILHKAVIRDSVVVTSGKIVEAQAVPDAAVEETAWLNNKLIFKQERFADLAIRLERWYNVRIIFDNDKYSAIRLTGVFKDQNIIEVMHALQLTQPFHYTLTDNQIHIW